MTPTDGGLIGRIIAICARNPGVTLLLALALGVWGWRALSETPLDAIPDLSDVQVIVTTPWEGQSPDVVEAQVTLPLSAALRSAPEARAVRGVSDFGISTIYVVFDDGADLYAARSRVSELLSAARARLPEDARPTLGPDASAVGWVFQYALVDRSGQTSIDALRTLQETTLRPALAALPGVAEVATVGGGKRQIQIELDPARLYAYDVSFEEVAMAAAKASDASGGHVLELSEHEIMVRGLGTAADLDDWRQALVRLGPAGPVTVGDLGEVSYGPAPQRGVAELDGQGEVVGGVVVMRFGQNALRVIDRSKERLAELAKALPPGVEIEVVYDRSELIRASIGTLRAALIEEMIVVSLVIFVFLLHVRSALIPIIALPLAVLVAFIPMRAQGLTANLMSISGIVVAVGAMVDASIILIDNAHRHLDRWEKDGRPQPRIDVLIRAMVEVGPSVFLSLLVLTVSFLPVFTLEGVEGRLFRPLAWTKTWSMAGASVLAVTLAPALAALTLRGRVRGEDEHPLTRVLVRAYAPVVRWVVRHPAWVLGGALTAMVATVPAFLHLGSEFMPPLQEGTLLYMPTAPPGISVAEAGRVLQHMDAVFKQTPEVAHAFGKMGRADSATDTAPLSMAEVTVTLKPQVDWRPGLTWEGLVAELDQKLQIPGMPNLFWMPIQTRTEMLSTGVRSPVGVQIFGPDLALLEPVARQIEAVLQALPGTRSATSERLTGGVYLDITPRRDALARLGLTVADVGALVRGAIGGMAVAEVVDGRVRLPVSVRAARDAREDPDALGRLPIRAGTGALVPLSEVATVGFSAGPPMIRSEDGQLVSTVYVDPGDTPLADYVVAAQQAVASQVVLPPGVRLGWTGQYTAFERARAQLGLMLPATLLLVLVLLYLNTGSGVETAMVMLAVPFSAIGAVWLLVALDYHLSVAVWVGIIALLGVDAETGVVMLLYLKLAWQRWSDEGLLQTRADLTEAIVEGAAHRIRPKLMTVATDFIGLLPVLWATGTGADVMKRIAAPLVGGLGTSFLLELLVYPALFALWKGRGLPLARNMQS